MSTVGPRVRRVVAVLLVTALLPALVSGVGSSEFKGTLDETALAVTDDQSAHAGFEAIGDHHTIVEPVTTVHTISDSTTEAIGDRTMIVAAVFLVLALVVVAWILRLTRDGNL